MVEGGMKCIKYLLFLFNLIFFITGLALIIAGALIQTQLTDYLEFLGGSGTGLAILLIVIGCIIFIIGFFGCCGAWKESYCMVMTFAFLLAIIFVLEIAAGIGAYVARDQVSLTITEEMDDTMSSYSTDQTIREAWNLAQHDFKCCGTNGTESWGSGSIPDSCCVTETDGCATGLTPGSTLLHQDGCLEAFIDWVESNILTIGGVGIGLAFVQVVGVFLSCCLARSIKKEYQVV